MVLQEEAAVPFLIANQSSDMSVSRGFHDYLLCLSYSPPIRHVANCQVDLVPHLNTRRSFWLAVFLGRKDCRETPMIAGEINSTGETFPSRCGADQLNSHYRFLLPTFLPARLVKRKASDEPDERSAANRRASALDTQLE